MPEPQRTVYGRAFAVTSPALWIAQRVSGLALAPMLAVHVAWPAVGHHRLFLAAFVLLLCGHGYAGLKRLRNAPSGSGAARAGAIGWTVAVAIAGGLIVVAGH